VVSWRVGELIGGLTVLVEPPTAQQKDGYMHMHVKSPNLQLHSSLADRRS